MHAGMGAILARILFESGSLSRSSSLSTHRVLFVRLYEMDYQEHQEQAVLKMIYQALHDLNGNCAGHRLRLSTPILLTSISIKKVEEIFEAFLIFNPGSRFDNHLKMQAKRESETKKKNMKKKQNTTSNEIVLDDEAVEEEDNSRQRRHCLGGS